MARVGSDLPTVTTRRELERRIPALAGSGYEVTSPPDQSYNCIGWAAGDDTKWWEPVVGPDGAILGGYYWPEGVPRAITREALMHAFRRQGYRECDSSDLIPGFEKVALYADGNGWTHAARQLSDGRWASKLGTLDDIAHDTPDAVTPTYGAVFAYMQRRRRPDQPHPSARNILSR